jgi:hypothetical protein
MIFILCLIEEIMLFDTQNHEMDEKQKIIIQLYFDFFRDF